MYVEAGSVVAVMARWGMIRLPRFVEVSCGKVRSGKAVMSS